jgi:hypothetical protein
MAYFIIPTTSGLVAQNTTIMLDKNISITNQPNKNYMKFGDGYSMSVPIAPPTRQYSFSLANRDASEANLVESYFNYLNTQVNFTNSARLINGLNIHGRAVSGEILRYSKAFVNDSTYTITGTIEQVYR